MTGLVLDPGRVTLAELERMSTGNVSRSSINRNAEAAIRQASQNALQKQPAAMRPSTGSTPASENSPASRSRQSDTATLQRNLILSHCCGVGEPLDETTTRLMMALKLLSLGRGASGVRFEVLELIEDMSRTCGVTPVVPSQGSVGASGDLAPLAHMTAVLIGEGEATLARRAVTRAVHALEKAGLKPVDPRPQGRPRSDQRHAVFHRLRACRAVRQPGALRKRP